MTHSLSVDRFEGRDRSIAVLVAEDGRSIDVPIDFLPPGIAPGDVLRATFERDDEATKRLAEETRKIQDELKATDPGGDLQL